MYVKSGSYTGNGSSLSVTGVGFAPDVVLVKGATALFAIIHTSTMASDAGKFSLDQYQRPSPACRT